MQRVLVALSLILCTSCGGTVSAGDDQTPADGHDAGPASDASGAATNQDAAEASVVGDAGGGYDAIVPPAGEKILFESSYGNYAWQPSVSGFFVTADGTVYKYDYYASAPPDAGYPYTEYEPPMTEAQVTGEYGTAATVFGKLDANELHVPASIPDGARPSSGRIDSGLQSINQAARQHTPGTATAATSAVGFDGAGFGEASVPTAPVLSGWPACGKSTASAATRTVSIAVRVAAPRRATVASAPAAVHIPGAVIRSAHPLDTSPTRWTGGIRAVARHLASVLISPAIPAALG